MMKKLLIISGFCLAASIISCDDVQRTRGSNYMPDMGESRAYETYAEHSNLGSKGIHYNSQPVQGTVSRGEELPYHLKNDTIGYNLSKAVPNPLANITAGDITEAERLYLINCAICHGTKLDGNGPLYATGKYLAKPATLVGDAKIEALPEGTIFHVETYGKNLMGSYASQLNRKQRWLIARYIKNKQAEGKAGAPATSAADSSAAGAPATK